MAAGPSAVARAARPPGVEADRSYHAGMSEASTTDPSEEPLVGPKPRSHEVTDGPTRAPARAMLRAVGMTDDDWDKPQIGVASSWNEVTPCNLPLDRLAKRAKDGVRRAGGFPSGVHDHCRVRWDLDGA